MERIRINEFRSKKFRDTLKLIISKKVGHNGFKIMQSYIDRQGYLQSPDDVWGFHNDEEKKHIRERICRYCISNDPCHGYFINYQDYKEFKRDNDLAEILEINSDKEPFSVKIGETLFLEKSSIYIKVISKTKKQFKFKDPKNLEKIRIARKDLVRGKWVCFDGDILKNNPFKNLKCTYKIGDILNYGKDSLFKKKLKFKIIEKSGNQLTATSNYFNSKYTFDIDKWSGNYYFNGKLLYKVDSDEKLWFFN